MHTIFVQMPQAQQHLDDYIDVSAQLYSTISVNSTLMSAHLTDDGEASNGIAPTQVHSEQYMHMNIVTLII